MADGNIGKNIGMQGLPVLNIGNPGNKGGPGRPKSEIRRACAEAFYDRIPMLAKIADAEEEGATTKTDRLKAIDLLGKYGVGNSSDITSGDQPLRYDLSKLNDEELDIFTALLAKISPEDDGGD